VTKLRPWALLILCRLIALLLGRLRLSVSEAINTYRALAKQIFSEKNNTGKDGTFKASNLERAIKETIELKLGEGHADDKMIMTDNMSENCKTYVSFHTYFPTSNNAEY